jgi:hypothetical protein
MAAAIVQYATIYCMVGVVVGIGFLVVGIDRIDPASRGAYAFRPLLLPGCVLLWPIVAFRWWRGS